MGEKGLDTASRWGGLSGPLPTPVALYLGAGRDDSLGARALRINSLPRFLASLSLSFLINKMGAVTVFASQASVGSQWNEPKRRGVAEASAQKEVTSFLSLTSL